MYKVSKGEGSKKELTFCLIFNRPIWDANNISKVCDPLWTPNKISCWFGNIFLVAIDGNGSRWFFQNILVDFALLVFGHTGEWGRVALHIRELGPAFNISLKSWWGGVDDWQGNSWKMICCFEAIFQNLINCFLNCCRDLSFVWNWKQFGCQTAITKHA